MTSNECNCENTDFDLSGIKPLTNALKEIDFELAYLVLLTRKGLKPLSRWEKSLAHDALRLIQHAGLSTKLIRRTVKTSKEIVETIFSRTPAYIQLYEERFSNTPVDKSAQTQRFEGFLFGYPPCCVENYINKPYAPNNLSEQAQKMLFHWACKDCKITPKLLRAYKGIYNSLNNR